MTLTTDAAGPAASTMRSPEPEVSVDFIRENYIDLRRIAAVAAPLNSDPDDILHVAVAQYLRHSKLKTIQNPMGYIYVSIRNAARNEAKRLGQSRKLQQRSAHEALTLDAHDVDGVDLAVLKHCSPTDRVILYLTVVEQTTVQGVADLLQTTPANVRMRRLRALRKLRTILESEA